MEEMTPTAIQQCTAMVCGDCGEKEDWRETAFVNGDTETSVFYKHRPDGWKFPAHFQHKYRNERPCGEPVAELPTGRFICNKCIYSGPTQDHANCGYSALVIHKLVHVTLGPCEECGHAWDPTHVVDFKHPYAPTLTERTMEHEAEVKK